MSTYLVKARILSRIEMSVEADDHPDAKRQLLYHLQTAGYLDAEIRYIETILVDGDDDLDYDLELLDDI